MCYRDIKGISVKWLYLIVTSTTEGANCGLGDNSVEIKRNEVMNVKAMTVPIESMGQWRTGFRVIQWRTGFTVVQWRTGFRVGQWRTGFRVGQWGTGFRVGQ